MELFHKYQGRSLQFALEVLALLSARERVTREELDGLARRLGLDYSGQVLRPMEAAGMLRLDQDGCRRRDRNTRAPLPLCRAEEEFLSFLLSRPEAACFLTPETAEKLRHQLVEREENLESIQRLRPKNRLDPLPQQENLAAILQAIRQGRMMEYTYQTRADPRLRQAVTLPWKVEYGAFDRRWWVIFYDPAARRTIKARLDNLSGLRLGAAVDISPEEIEEAMETLLEPEPVVLGVSPNRGRWSVAFWPLRISCSWKPRRRAGNVFSCAFVGTGLTAALFFAGCSLWDRVLLFWVQSLCAESCLGFWSRRWSRKQLRPFAEHENTAPPVPLPDRGRRSAFGLPLRSISIDFEKDRAGDLV